MQTEDENHELFCWVNTGFTPVVSLLQRGLQPLGHMSGDLTTGHHGAEMVRNFLREIKYIKKKRAGFSMRWHYFHAIIRFLKYVWCLSQGQTGNILGFCNACFPSFRVTPTK